MEKIQKQGSAVLHITRPTGLGLVLKRDNSGNLPILLKHAVNARQQSTCLNDVFWHVYIESYLGANFKGVHGSIVCSHCTILSIQ